MANGNIPQIKAVELKSGGTRYEFCTVVTNPDGTKKQTRLRFGARKDAEAEWRRLTSGRADGKVTAPWNGTVNDLIADYLTSGKIRSREANTRLSYEMGLKAAGERLGARKARSVTRQDVEALGDWLLAAGRRRGGKAGTGLSYSSVEYVIKRLSAAFELAVRDGKLPGNPCKYAEIPRPDGDSDDEESRVTWSDEQIDQFLQHARTDRLYGCWRLWALGLRRGELAGLQWVRVDLDAGTVTITRRNSTRVMVYRQGVVSKGPKSERGVRVLALDDDDIAALRALKARQAAEKLAAGPAYEDSGYVLADELGAPVKPDRYSRQFLRLARDAGLSRIELHGLRRSLNVSMSVSGASDNVRADWLGHRVEVNKTSYLDRTDATMAAARQAISAARRTS